MIPPTNIEDRIRICGGRPTLRAAELAVVYGVSARTLLECVRRRGPLPGEYAFLADSPDMTGESAEERRPGGRLVFTEHGAIAAAYLIGTALALENSVHVVRAFARYRARMTGDRPAAGRGDIVAEADCSYSSV